MLEAKQVQARSASAFGCLCCQQEADRIIRELRKCFAPIGLLILADPQKAGNWTAFTAVKAETTGLWNHTVNYRNSTGRKEWTPMQQLRPRSKARCD
jgi:hypothetical protein